MGTWISQRGYRFALLNNGSLGASKGLPIRSSHESPNQCTQPQSTVRYSECLQIEFSYKILHNCPSRLIFPERTWKRSHSRRTQWQEFICASFSVSVCLVVVSLCVCVCVCVCVPYVCIHPHQLIVAGCCSSLPPVISGLADTWDRWCGPLRGGNRLATGPDYFLHSPELNSVYAINRGTQGDPDSTVPLTLYTKGCLQTHTHTHTHSHTHSQPRTHTATPKFTTC